MTLIIYFWKIIAHFVDTLTLQKQEEVREGPAASQRWYYGINRETNGSPGR